MSQHENSKSFDKYLPLFSNALKTIVCQGNKWPNISHCTKVRGVIITENCQWVKMSTSK